MYWQFEVYQIGIHSWGWKLRKPDGTLLCMSAEHYKDAEQAEIGIDVVKTVTSKIKKIVYIDSQGEEIKRGAKKSRKETPKKEKKSKAGKDAKKRIKAAKQSNKKPLKSKTKTTVL